ncbi:unnamed protein product [Diplocarpon coronariae]|nr:hypothetical protein JHW43_008768 [Diplocarpon mali]
MSQPASPPARSQSITPWPIHDQPPHDVAAEEAAGMKTQRPCDAMPVKPPKREKQGRGGVEVAQHNDGPPSESDADADAVGSEQESRVAHQKRRRRMKG